jgi:hypothetical protein
MDVVSEERDEKHQSEMKNCVKLVFETRSAR